MTPEEFMERALKALEARANDGDTLLDMDEAASLLRISRQAVYERHKLGKMPKPIPASTRRRPLWKKKDLIG
jgi:predicted DNA-binding transcriptional regulator AlpA